MDERGGKQDPRAPVTGQCCCELFRTIATVMQVAMHLIARKPVEELCVTFLSASLQGKEEQKKMHGGVFTLPTPGSQGTVTALNHVTESMM